MTTSNLCVLTVRWDLVEACGILLSELLVHLVTLISVALKEKEAVTLCFGVNMFFKVQCSGKHSHFFTDTVSQGQGTKSLPKSSQRQTAILMCVRACAHVCVRSLSRTWLQGSELHFNLRAHGRTPSGWLACRRAVRRFLTSPLVSPSMSASRSRSCTGGTHTKWNIWRSLIVVSREILKLLKSPSKIQLCACSYWNTLYIKTSFYSWKNLGNIIC